MPRRTLRELLASHAEGSRWVMTTAYDFPTARLAEEAGVDLILVGDSVGQAVYGEPDTVTVTLDDMIRHARAVARGAAHSFVVADLPFLTYQVSEAEALHNAGRLLAEARVQAVKLEGGRSVAPTVARLVAAGIPVMAHLGFTPQSVYRFGGYTVQGRSAAAAEALYLDALAVQAAGAFALVLEMVPAPLATWLTERLSIPTIGIGAGAGTSGQVLVLHDLIGLYAGRSPRFAKRYADVAGIVRAALAAYAGEVRAGTFPGPEHQFAMDADVLARVAAKYGPDGHGAPAPAASPTNQGESPGGGHR
jgi:3-methyl-2-oxobutanoate hydroxymethyltransferase